MTNVKPSLIALFRVPIRIKTKADKKLFIIPSLQLHQDRRLWNYSELNISSKINDDEHLMKGCRFMEKIFENIFNRICFKTTSLRYKFISFN